MGIKKFNNIDEYISLFPVNVQKKLIELRAIIRELAPRAQEKISYQMPTFYLTENLVHFAAYENHIGFYPTPCGIAAFEKDLAKYKHAKGSIQFPINEDLPTELIRRIVKFRVDEISKNLK